MLSAEQIRPEPLLGIPEQKNYLPFGRVRLSMQKLTIVPSALS
jgi:hypothetical protein